MLDMEVVRNLDVLTANDPGTASCTQGCRFVGGSPQRCEPRSRKPGNGRVTATGPFPTMFCSCTHTSLQLRLQLRLEVGDNGDDGAGVTATAFTSLLVAFSLATSKLAFSLATSKLGFSLQNQVHMPAAAPGSR